MKVFLKAIHIRAPSGLWWLTIPSDILSTMDVQKNHFKKANIDIAEKSIHKNVPKILGLRYINAKI
jgi:hypothetical protein